MENIEKLQEENKENKEKDNEKDNEKKREEIILSKQKIKFPEFEKIFVGKISEDKEIVFLYNYYQSFYDILNKRGETDINSRIIKSMLFICMIIRQYGLSINPFYAELYMIMYKSSIALSVGYQGMRKLIIRANKEIKNIYAEIVKKTDKFEINLGENKISHIPDIDTPMDYENIRGAYGRIIMNDGKEILYYISKEEIEKIRKLSPSQKIDNKISETPVGIWKDFYRQLFLAKTIKFAKYYISCNKDINIDEFDVKI